MKAIIENLTDPGFMIPALCVAVIAGIGVSYMRSGLDSIVSYLTGKNKQKKAERQARQEREASMTASHPILLNRAIVNLASVHVEFTVLMVALIILFCMAFALPVRNAIGGVLLLLATSFIAGCLTSYYNDRRNRMKTTQRAINIFFKKTE